MAQAKPQKRLRTPERIAFGTALKLLRLKTGRRQLEVAAESIFNLNQRKTSTKSGKEKSAAQCWPSWPIFGR